VGSRCPRAVDPAGVDGLGQGDVEQVAAGLDEQAEVSDGGEPRAQGAAGVAHGAEHPQRRIVLDRGEHSGLSPAPHQEVDLHVHEAGEQGDVAQIEHLTLARATCAARAARDAVSVDGDQARLLDRPRLDVQDTGGLERDHVQTFGSTRRSR
jgi:hypothetical protein